MDKIDFVVNSLDQIGGVSTHVKRLLPYLKRNNINFSILCPQESKNKLKDIILKSFWFLKLLLKKNHNLIHFHKSFGFPQFLYWYLFSKINTSNIIITIHNDNLLHYGVVKKTITLELLKRTKYLELFVVSDKLYDFLNDSSVRCKYLPAYVPPEVTEFIHLHSNRPLFLYSVFRATKENISSTYGFDIALDMLVRFKKEFNMLFLIGDKARSDIEVLERMLKEKEVEENVIIVYNSELVSYVKNCSFILRPNRKDGYGISLQEALDMSVLAVASSVCKRPEGTLTYGSFDELVEIVKKILTLNDEEKFEILSRRQRLEYHIQLIKIYKLYLDKKTK